MRPGRFGPHADDTRGVVLVTGGAGFVGSNLADALLRGRRRVRVLDNLSRAGVELNLRWLEERHGERVEVIRGDVRDREAVELAVAEDVTLVYHLAAQVAVTTSLLDPLEDLAVNGFGTLNVLEAARARVRKPGIVFTSTNKVYGALGDLGLAERASRYEPADAALLRSGVDERRPVEFHSPYGCSKGAADQYVLDYARTFGLRTAVFRMSCIYGPRQFGTEDQGWVAHFLLQALAGKPITIYGDGKQVRDVLFVADLVDALITAGERLDELSGQAFNMGGGPDNALSLVELLERISRLLGREPETRYEDWRVGDQRYYVSDTGRFRDRTGWQPRHGVEDGLGELHRWLEDLLQRSDEPRVREAG